MQTRQLQFASVIIITYNAMPLKLVFILYVYSFLLSLYLLRQWCAKINNNIVEVQRNTCTWDVEDWPLKRERLHACVAHVQFELNARSQKSSTATAKKNKKICMAG